jgi:predicted nucleic acid-binding protein
MLIRTGELEGRRVKVLDASAVLASLPEEKGGDKAEAAPESGIMSVVNLAEVVQRFRRENKRTEGLVVKLELARVQWDQPNAARCGDPRSDGLHETHSACRQLLHRAWSAARRARG